MSNPTQYQYRSEVNGKGGISARVVAHSKSSVNGKELVTFELTYHRFIHAELMTHRMFSRNAMSSRAVPVEKMIEQVRDNPAMPIHWGKNQPGMQAKDEWDEVVRYKGGEAFTREDWWQLSADEATNAAELLDEAGYHKQIVNRLLEPFQFMRTVVTATEFDNFFWLRRHPDAQPEIQELANCMWQALNASEPTVLAPGDWHTPYYGKGFWKQSEATESLETAQKVSASCCAQASFRKLDTSQEKAENIYQPMKYPKHERFPKMAIEYGALEDGLTHVDVKGCAWSGNFQSWIQYRQLLPQHTCWYYQDNNNN